jgi:hypothetical protein
MNIKSSSAETRPVATSAEEARRVRRRTELPSVVSPEMPVWLLREAAFKVNGEVFSKSVVCEFQTELAIAKTATA